MTRSQRLAADFRWSTLRRVLRSSAPTAAQQCEGCTFFTGHALELSYLHSRDGTYATICAGTYRESSRYRDFMRWEMPWYSLRDSAETLLCGGGFGAYANYLRDGDRVFETYWSDGRGTEAGATSYHLLDMTVYGRQGTWEDSPAGWPRDAPRTSWIDLLRKQCGSAPVSLSLKPVESSRRGLDEHSG